MIFKRPVLEIPKEYLEEILVLSYLNRGIKKYDNGSFTIQTGDLGLLPGHSFPDILYTMQTLPGIQSNDESISNINVRASSNDHNLYLWNDIQMYQTGHLFGLISAFNTSLPHNTVVSKNLVNSRYTGGIASIMALESEFLDKTTASFGIGLIDTNVSTNIKVSDATIFQFAFRKSINDFVKTSPYKAYQKRIIQGSEINDSRKIDFNFYDATATLIHKFNKHHSIKGYAMIMSNDLKYNSGLNEVNSDLTQKHQSVGYKYEYHMNSSAKLTHKSYYTDYELNSSLNNVTERTTISQNNSVKDFGTSISLLKSFSDINQLEIGLQSSQKSVFDRQVITNPNITDNRIAALTSHEIYGQLDLKNKKNTVNLLAGMRLSYLPFYDQLLWEPQVNLNYAISDRFEFLLAAQRTNQTTFQIIDEPSDFQGIEKRRWRINDFNDNPLLTSFQSSLALQYNDNSWVWSLEGYWKSIDNLLSGSQNFNGAVNDRNAIGESNSLGAEIVVNKKFKNWSAWVSYHYNYSRSSFHNISQNRSFPSSFNIRNNINLSAVHKLNSWEFAFGMNIHDGITFTSPIDFDQSVVTNDDIQYETINSSRLPYYLRADFSLNKTIVINKKSKIHFTGSVWNITGRNNLLARYFIANNNRIQQIEEQSLERFYNLGVKYVFD